MNYLSKITLSLSFLLFFGACSSTTEPLIPSNLGVAGASVGGVAGGIIGNSQFSDSFLGTVVGGGLGALTGLAVGEISEAKRIKNIQNSSEPKRLPKIEFSNAQRDIDAAWLELERETKLGEGEVKPWNERYLDNDSHLPYQGQ